jgi:hypothetical protein
MAIYLEHPNEHHLLFTQTQTKTQTQTQTHTQTQTQTHTHCPAMRLLFHGNKNKKLLVLRALLLLGNRARLRLLPRSCTRRIMRNDILLVSLIRSF